MLKLGVPLVVIQGKGRLAGELADPDRAGEFLMAQEAASLREKEKFMMVDGVHGAEKILDKLKEQLF